MWSKESISIILTQVPLFLGETEMRKLLFNYIMHSTQYDLTSGGRNTFSNLKYKYTRGIKVKEWNLRKLW